MIYPCVFICRGWYGNLTRIVCKLMPALVDYINVANICTYLLAEELLTFDERHEILELIGKHRQVPYLFEILTTKGRDWYTRFWRALNKSVSWNADVHLGHKDLLEMLPNASEEMLALDQKENGELEERTLDNSRTKTNEKNQLSQKNISESIGNETPAPDCKCEQLQKALGQAQNCCEDITMENQHLTQENGMLKQEKKYLEEVIEKMEGLACCSVEADKLFNEKNTNKKSTWV